MAGFPFGPAWPLQGLQGMPAMGSAMVRRRARGGAGRVGGEAWAAPARPPNPEAAANDTPRS